MPTILVQREMFTHLYLLKYYKITEPVNGHFPFQFIAPRISPGTFPRKCFHLSRKQFLPNIFAD